MVDWNACDSCVNGKRAEDAPKLVVRKREGCKRLENSFFAFVMNGEAMFYMQLQIASQIFLRN